MSEASGSQQQPAKVQEFVVRAPGALHQGIDYFLGKFPEGFSDFKTKKKGWTLHRQPEDANARRRGPDPKKPRVMPWVLADLPGHTTHTGLPEGGITGSGTGMGYFVLVKEGPNFTALPIKDWYNFRPASRGNAMSLEEAEKQMNSRGTVSRLAAGSKLGALAAKAAVEGEAMEEGDQEGDAPESDEERESQRVARLPSAKGGTAEAEEENMPGTNATAVEGQPDRVEKGEDWDCEVERADDDLEQGDVQSSDEDDLNTGVKREKGERDSENGEGLTQAGQELDRILRKAKISSGSEDGEGSQDDDSDDDIDLDEMASGILSKVKADPEGRAASGSRQATPQPAKPPLGKAGSKRKAVTPPIQEDAKKVRAAVKQESGGAAPSRARPITPTGPPTPQEILGYLKASNNITSHMLYAHFKGRMTNNDEKRAFSATVKTMVKLVEGPPGSGKKFINLKNAYL